MIQKKEIDRGTGFDWGRTSGDYARYRDIYPQEFYQRLLDRGICTAGQDVLDIGTGTGVIPRNLYSHGETLQGLISLNSRLTMPESLRQKKIWILGFCVLLRRMCRFRPAHLTR